jgi:ketosteroid isomerase-like protein
MSNVQTARDYLRAIETNAAVTGFFTPDIVQEEYPNRLNPHGGRSDLSQMQARAERGRGMVREQRYDVQRVFESGDTVILEVAWSAAFNIPVGDLKPGELMKARFAVFLEFQNGKIHRQRNYDCFEPF